MSETTRFGKLEITHDAYARPRPWAEQQSAWAADLMATAPPGPVLELCCGAGEIGLLAIAESSRSLVCVDIDPIACAFASTNARTADLVDRVDVREGNLDEVLRPGEQFALVVADPPWRRQDRAQCRYESPVSAVESGSQGLDLVRRCVAVIVDRLLPGGSAILQVGTWGQVATLRQELTALDGTLQVVDVRDLGGGMLLRLDHLPAL